MMKRLLPIAIIICLLLAGGLVIYATTLLINSDTFLATRGKSSSPTPCQTTNTNHQVVIVNGMAVPEHIQAKLCDTLTITNHDNRPYLLAFGEHEVHATYDGITEKSLNLDENLFVTLNQAGTFVFHDHLQDKVKGDFAVTD